MDGALNFDLTNTRHRALKRMILGRRDIDAALQAIKYIIENVKEGQYHPLYDPLSCAAVICYSRPFINRRQYPALPSKYSKFSDQELHWLHFAVIDLRNNFVAHCDESAHKVVLIPKGAEISWGDGKGRGIVASHGEFIGSRSLAVAHFPLFRELCEYQLQRLRERISSEKTALFP